MFNKMIKTLVNSFHYEINKHLPVATNYIESVSAYEIYRYRKPDGTFDYEMYKQIQIARNKRKIEVRTIRWKIPHSLL